MASLCSSASGVMGMGLEGGGQEDLELVLSASGVTERKCSRCWSCTEARPASLVPGPFIPFTLSRQETQPRGHLFFLFPRHRSSRTGLSSAIRCMAGVCVALSSTQVSWDTRVCLQHHQSSWSLPLPWWGCITLFLKTPQPWSIAPRNHRPPLCKPQQRSALFSFWQTHATTS